MSAKTMISPPHPFRGRGAAGALRASCLVAFFVAGTGPLCAQVEAPSDEELDLTRLPTPEVTLHTDGARPDGIAGPGDVFDGGGVGPEQMRPWPEMPWWPAAKPKGGGDEAALDMRAFERSSAELASEAPPEGWRRQALLGGIALAVLVVFVLLLTSVLSRSRRT